MIYPSSNLSEMGGGWREFTLSSSLLYVLHGYP